MVDKYKNLDQSLNAPKTIMLLDALTKNETKIFQIGKLVTAMSEYLSQEEVFQSIEPLNHAKAFHAFARHASFTSQKSRIIDKIIEHLH